MSTSSVKDQKLGCVSKLFAVDSLEIDGQRSSTVLAI